MSEMNARATSQEACFGQQYLLKKGLEKFGERGTKSNEKELRQLHDRTCFRPISIAGMNTDEKKKAMEALMFLTEKRDCWEERLQSICESNNGQEGAHLILVQQINK